MSAANFWAVAAALLLGFLGSCGIIISSSSGGIPELAYIAVPMLAGGIAIFWIVVKRYPRPVSDGAGEFNTGDTEKR